MSIEADNLDSLRKLVRELQAENTLLKKKLKKANITYPESCIFEEKIENTSEFDPDQGGRIIRKYITEEMANRYFAMFWGRTDVYAKRGKNGGYFPQCNNRWNDRLCPKQQGEKIHCEDCKNTSWTKLTAKKIVEHLLGYKDDGSDVIGVYPLLPDGTCRFIVFDFDNHEKGAEETDFANSTKDWHKEVEALRLICEKNGITPLVERSRSGQRANVWVQMKTSGIQVVIKDEVDEHFAVIDEELVWHGGMNLLGKEDVWDNLIRIKSAVVAEELLELSFGNQQFQTNDINSLFSNICR